MLLDSSIIATVSYRTFISVCDNEVSHADQKEYIGYPKDYFSISVSG